MLIYFSNSKIPSKLANSVHVMKMCNAFSEHHNDVTLVAESNGDITGYSIFEQYKVHSNFSIEFYSTFDFWLSRLLLKAKDVFSFLKIGPLPALLYWLLIDHPIFKQEPQLYYGRNLYALFRVRNKSIPFIIECHRPADNLIEKLVLKALLKNKNCRGIVVISDALKILITQQYSFLNSDKVYVHHDGADLPSDISEPIKRKNIKSFKIGYVGRLYEGRGLDIILKCAQALPAHEFHIVGGSKHEINSIDEHTWPENVIFHGYVNQEKVDEYLRSFDIVLAPYQHVTRVGGNTGNTAAYMSPLKIFEYMAYQKIILSSDLPALHEILTDDVTAYLLKPDDAKAWIQKLIWIENNYKSALKVSKQAHQNLKKHYTWSKRADNILKHY